jgi:hypothetical protein
VRELAYAGSHLDAMCIMDAMSDQNDDRVLTYRGFTNRKLGNVDVAMVFHQKAIDKDPDNILARSYMGQGMMDQDNKLVLWHNYAKSMRAVVWTRGRLCHCRTRSQRA